MAIPTDFKGPTPAANTTKSFKIFGTTTVGVWGLDIDGTLTPKVVPLADSCSIIMTTAYTDAQLAVMLQGYIEKLGLGRNGQAGGSPAQGTGIVSLTSTVCT